MWVLNKINMDKTNATQTKLLDIRSVTIGDLWGKLFDIAERCEAVMDSALNNLPPLEYPTQYCSPDITYMGKDYMTISFTIRKDLPLQSISQLIQDMFATFDCWGSFDSSFNKCDVATLEFNISIDEDC